jgi:hypothetical protein
VYTNSSVFCADAGTAHNIAAATNAVAKCHPHLPMPKCMLLSRRLIPPENPTPARNGRQLCARGPDAMRTYAFDDTVAIDLATLAMTRR